MLKEQIEALIRENSILKRAVAIQHERQKEYEDKNRELQHLKQLLSQYQEQLRTLEVRVKTFVSPLPPSPSSIISLFVFNLRFCLFWCKMFYVGKLLICSVMITSLTML